MPQIPPLPVRGSIPDAIWIALDKINAYLRSLPIRGDGKTASVSQTDGAFVISAIAGKEINYTEKEIFFLEVTDIDANGCPNTTEWHKITVPVISDIAEDPPTV